MFVCVCVCVYAISVEIVGFRITGLLGPSGAHWGTYVCGLPFLCFLDLQLLGFKHKLIYCFSHACTHSTPAQSFLPPAQSFTPTRPAVCVLPSVAFLPVAFSHPYSLLLKVNMNTIRTIQEYKPLGGIENILSSRASLLSGAAPTPPTRTM